MRTNTDAHIELLIHMVVVTEILELEYGTEKTIELLERFKARAVEMREKLKTELLNEIKA